MTEISFEQAFKEFLTRRKIRYQDFTGSGTELDIALPIKGGDAAFNLELKEKRQATNTSAWPTVPYPKDHILILDDLTARKILRWAPLSGLVFMDRMTGLYTFFDVVTLMLAPRVRANRPQGNGQYKGKWMLNRDDGYSSPSLDKILDWVKEYIQNQQHIFETYTACYGAFDGESIPVGGEVRTREQREYDYRVTR